MSDIYIVAGKIRPSCGEVRFFGQRITGKPAHQVGTPWDSAYVTDCAALCWDDRARCRDGRAPFGRAGGRHRLSAAQRNAEAALMRLALGSQRDKAADSLNLVDRKRIDLARALAMNPMLLLDEVMV